MGHKPNNGKVKHRRGLWSPDEDQKLADYIRNNGHACWSSIPAKAGLQRNGKSCRLRWINYLRPGLKRGTFTLEEREIVLTLHRMLGNKWAEISKYLPGRTDNEIKNYWHSNLKNRINVKVEDSQSLKTSHLTSSSMSSMSLQSHDTMNSGSSLMGSSSLSTSFCQPDTPATNFPSGGSMPKLLFTEWLSLDQEQQDAPTFVGGNGSQSIPRDCFDHFTSCQDYLLPELSFEESLFYSESNQGNSFDFSHPYGLMGLIEELEPGSGNGTSNLEDIFYT